MIVESLVLTPPMHEQIRALLSTHVCQDYRGKWYAATIEERKDDGKVLVHYSGWESRWDEWIDTAAADTERLKELNADGDWQLLYRATRDG